MDLASGTIDRLLPGVSLTSYQISRDGKEALFSRGWRGADSEIWLAAFDRRPPPRLITRDGDQAFFGAPGELIFRELGATQNFAVRINEGGSGRQRVFSTPIIDLQAVSPDGSWIVASRAGGASEPLPDMLALPVDGGPTRKICTGYCEPGWSADGRLFFVPIAGKTIVVPIPHGRQLPDLPASGIEGAKLPGLRQIQREDALPGPDPSTYVYAETRLGRNLYRIPLH